MIRVTCKCGFCGSVPPNYAGKQVKCRKCTRMITVPVQQPRVEAEAKPPAPPCDASPVVPVQVPAESQASFGKRRAIALTRLELLEKMPPVCICCGAPATATRLMRFNRMEVRVRSRRIGGLISVFMQVLRSRDIGKHQLQAPCCGRHKNQRGWNFWASLATLGVFGMILGGVAALRYLPWTNAQFLVVFPVWVIALYFVIWLIDITVNRMVEQFEVHDKFLFLRNVSPAFRDAMDLLRRQRNSESEVAYTNAKLDSIQRWSVIKRRLGLYFIPSFFAVLFVIGLCVRGADGQLTDSAWISAPVAPFGQSRGTIPGTAGIERLGDPPQPLANKVLAAWKEAGAQVGCIEVDVYAHVDFSEEPFTKSNRDRPGLVFQVPAFRFVSWRRDQLTKLPVPPTPFGLFLYFTEKPGRGLKALADMQSLQALEDHLRGHDRCGARRVASASEFASAGPSRQKGDG
jgi:hypothetical protein